MTTGYGTPGMDLGAGEDGRCLSSQAALPPFGLSPEDGSQAKPAAANAVRKITPQMGDAWVTWDPGFEPVPALTPRQNAFVRESFFSGWDAAIAACEAIAVRWRDENKASAAKACMSMDIELQHRIAWTLYCCEKRRADNATGVVSEAAGKPVSGAAMEPWEEVKDMYLADAAEVLSATATPPDSPASQSEACKDLHKALKWALPLAESALNDHRLERIRCGHSDIVGTDATGKAVLGLWQNEVDQRDQARAALRASAASVDTRPKDEDPLGASLASGAVPKADAQTSEVNND